MKKRIYSHSKAKQQADKNYSMNKVSLSVAFSRFEAESDAGVVLICNGQVGAKHWRLAC